MIGGYHYFWKHPYDRFLFEMGYFHPGPNMERDLDDPPGRSSASCARDGSQSRFGGHRWFVVCYMAKIVGFLTSVVMNVYNNVI